MKRTGSLVLGALALLSACGGDFDPGSRVTTLRVLAVKADAPYAAPGEAVHLDALAFDPAGRPLTWGWGFCVDPTSPSVFACIDAMRGTSFVIGADRSTFDVTVPSDALSAVPVEGQPRATVGVVTVVCPGDLSYNPGPERIDATGVMPFTCRDTASGRTLATEEYVVGVKRIFVRATDKNENPSFAKLTWDGVEWPETEAKIAAPCPTTGHRFTDCDASLRHTVGADVPASDAETGVDSFGTPFVEQAIVEYYATDGIFEHDVRVATDASTGWVAQTAAVGPTVHMWFVVHDNRGGVDWLERGIKVGAPAP